MRELDPQSVQLELDAPTKPKAAEKLTLLEKLHAYDYPAIPDEADAFAAEAIYREYYESHP